MKAYAALLVLGFALLGAHLGCSYTTHIPRKPTGITVAPAAESSSASASSASSSAPAASIAP